MGHDRLLDVDRRCGLCRRDGGLRAGTPTAEGVDVRHLRRPVPGGGMLSLGRGFVPLKSEAKAQKGSKCGFPLS